MIITILIFIVVLGGLGFVHEFGHCIVAKKAGCKWKSLGLDFRPHCRSAKSRWEVEMDLGT